jgi:hypothetical protein
MVLEGRRFNDSTMIQAELHDALAEFQIINGIKCFEWWCAKWSLGDYLEGNNVVRREVFLWRTKLAWKIFDHFVLCVCVYIYMQIWQFFWFHFPVAHKSAGH